NAAPCPMPLQQPNRLDGHGTVYVDTAISLSLVFLNYCTFEQEGENVEVIPARYGIVKEIRSGGNEK
ncbi:hypothetical protein AVEN_159812-1, partial [Araneus ventricosus]